MIESILQKTASKLAIQQQYWWILQGARVVSMSLSHAMRLCGAMDNVPSTFRNPRTCVYAQTAEFVCHTRLRLYTIATVIAAYIPIVAIGGERARR
jgi:hypothetical protein